MKKIDFNEETRYLVKYKESKKKDNYWLDFEIYEIDMDPKVNNTDKGTAIIRRACFNVRKDLRHTSCYILGGIHFVIFRKNFEFDYEITKKLFDRLYDGIEYIDKEYSKGNYSHDIIEIKTESPAYEVEMFYDYINRVFGKKKRD